MAYVSKELKAKLAPQIKAVLKKFKIKGSIAVRNHSTLVVNIKSGPIDFISNYNQTLTERFAAQINTCRFATDYIQVNEYHYANQYSGKALQFLKALISATNDGNWDKSDRQTDYFNVGWYTNINIGQWNKPYILSK